MKNRWLMAVMAMVIFSTIGCSSIRSTLLTRNEHNTGWSQVPHLKGVPVTVKVPTHLKVIVKEKHFLANTSVGGINRYDYIKLPTPMRYVETDVEYSEKVFTVDFKRPAAGTMNLTLDMDAEKQYFDQIQHEVEDQTLDQIGSLVGSLGQAGLFGAASTNTNDSDNNLKEVESTVAYQLFEIDDPNFETQVKEFLNCHINKAHDAWVVPPGVESIKRVGMADSGGNKSPLCQGGGEFVIESPLPLEPVGCASGACGN